MASRILIISRVGGGHRGIEATYGLVRVAQLKSGRTSDHLDLAVVHPVQSLRVILVHPLVQSGACDGELAGALLLFPGLGQGAGGAGGQHGLHARGRPARDLLAGSLQQRDCALCLLRRRVALDRGEGQSIGSAHRVASNGRGAQGAVEVVLRDAGPALVESAPSDLPGRLCRHGVQAVQGGAGVAPGLDHGHGEQQFAARQPVDLSAAEFVIKATQIVEPSVDTGQQHRAARQRSIRPAAPERPRPVARRQ